LEQRIDLGLSRILSYALNRRWMFDRLFKKYTERYKWRESEELCGTPYFVAKEAKFILKNLLRIFKEFSIESFVYN